MSGLAGVLLSYDVSYDQPAQSSLGCFFVCLFITYCHFAHRVPCVDFYYLLSPVYRPPELLFIYYVSFLTNSYQFLATLSGKHFM